MRENREVRSRASVNCRLSASRRERKIHRLVLRFSTTVKHSHALIAGAIVSPMGFEHAWNMFN